MTRRATAAILAVLGGLAASAPAGAADMMDKPSFQKADKNGDGKISQDEAEKVGFNKYQFFRQDVDQDGFLTKEDWSYISGRSNFNLYNVKN